MKNNLSLPANQATKGKSQASSSLPASSGGALPATGRSAKLGVRAGRGCGGSSSTANGSNYSTSGYSWSPFSTSHQTSNVASRQNGQGGKYPPGVRRFIYFLIAIAIAAWLIWNAAL